MYTLARNSELRRKLLPEMASMIIAFGIAELFYKFHSFARECAAFLATWFAISYVWSVLGQGARVGGGARS